MCHNMCQLGIMDTGSDSIFFSLEYLHYRSKWMNETFTKVTIETFAHLRTINGWRDYLGLMQGMQYATLCKLMTIRIWHIITSSMWLSQSVNVSNQVHDAMMPHSYVWCYVYLIYVMLGYFSWHFWPCITRSWHQTLLLMILHSQTLVDDSWFFIDYVVISQIAKFMGPTWGSPGTCRPQMGPMLAPWTLLSGMSYHQMSWNNGTMRYGFKMVW